MSHTKQRRYNAIKKDIEKRRLSDTQLVELRRTSETRDVRRAAKALLIERYCPLYPISFMSIAMERPPFNTPSWHNWNRDFLAYCETEEYQRVREWIKEADEIISVITGEPRSAVPQAGYPPNDPRWPSLPVATESPDPTYPLSIARKRVQ